MVNRRKRNKGEARVLGPMYVDRFSLEENIRHISPSKFRELIRVMESNGTEYDVGKLNNLQNGETRGKGRSYRHEISHEGARFVSVTRRPITITSNLESQDTSYST
jgi:hypothetical protein|tara:strand:+ start:93 stop:410 length:318 start_codon:yes stop_codon:yes gene_type:complete